MISRGDRQRGDIAVSCIRVAAGAKDEEQVRRVRVDPRIRYMCVLYTTLIRMRY